MKEEQTLPAPSYERVAGIMQTLREENDRFAAAYGFRRPAFVLTFGCQQNEADSEKIRGMAEAMGYAITDKPEDAYLIVVNTCAIREHAEKRALSIIGQYKHIKEKNPELVIAVCGCMVTQEHRRQDIKFRYPYVDFIFGTSSLHRFPELLAEKRRTGKRIYCPAEEDMILEGLPVLRESTYRAWVPIMTGCNNFCTYCIVPYVRGRERSRKKEEIVREVRDLVARGYKDITLLGQNVNSYGRDGAFPYDFADLLEELDAIPGDYWLHFMSSHPKDATRKLIDVMAGGVHIAKHFHLPLQSGNDRVLLAMNRHYDATKYKETVAYLREKIPDVTLSSDIIVGFPTETEEEFEDTLTMLSLMRYDSIFSFIYSPRVGTPAASMEQVPDVTKGERFDRLLKLQNEISEEVNRKLLGTTVRVLCDGPSKNDEKVYSGRTAGNKIVFFEGKGDPRDVGKFVDVKITKTEPFALTGIKVSE